MLRLYTNRCKGIPKQVMRPSSWTSLRLCKSLCESICGQDGGWHGSRYIYSQIPVAIKGSNREGSLRMATNAISIQSDASVNAAIAGDAMSGFEELYRKHYRRVYSICLRMTGNIAEAEDLTQEVFIQLHRKIGSFRGEAAFTTWLHRLTVNQVLMHFRKRSVRSELTTDDGEMPDSVDPDTINPEAMPIVDRIGIENAIAQLPPGYRTVFVLHDVEGYEHEEIAKLLGCSAGTSKSQLHKARLKLRRLLQQRAEAA